MQKMHSRFNSKVWRNGLALLLLLCFVGTANLNAQSVYASTEMAEKLVRIEVETIEKTERVMSYADVMHRKFYLEVAAHLNNGMSVEDALETSRTYLVQLAFELGTFTIQDVDVSFSAVDELLRN